MSSQSSIKWRPIWKVWIPIVMFFVPLIMESQMLGTFFTPYIYGLIVLVVGIIYWFRFRLWQSIVLMGWMAITIWTYFLSAHPEQTEYMLVLLSLDPGPGFVTWLKACLGTPAWLGFLVINFVIFYTMGPTLLKALELEKTAIRLFKLAAREVSGEMNGFTGRPFQAGEHPYKRTQIIGLASFLEKNKICLAEFTESGISFIFSMGISPLNNKYKAELSYVAFGDDGKLNVFISGNDYRQYKKEYTFDHLCELMGKTFLRFADYYDQKIEHRIITEMKSL